MSDIEDFTVLHERACTKGESTYTDPTSGYLVFTESAHKKRGKCCGSGCRHCPYNHENVRDKASCIQQPALMYEGDKDSLVALEHGNIHVMFYSGGKDSFLAVRALLRQARAFEHFGLVLLTTFDADSRVIAHQEIHIETVLEQARIMGIAMVGVPLHRGSSEDYLSRIQKGIDLVEKETMTRVEALVFGDLHLQHIIQWREEQLGKFQRKLVYPLLNTPYNALMDDLEASGVKCIVSASTVPQYVHTGDVFDRSYWMQLKQIEDLDSFGEKGEFHTAVQMRETSKDKILGL